MRTVQEAVGESGYLGGAELTGLVVGGGELADAEFEDCTFIECVFESTTLAVNLALDVRENRVEGARFGVAGALGLLEPFGVVVE